MTTVKHYKNKRNEHKHLEVHNDGHRHNSVKAYMQFPNGVRNDLGDRCLIKVGNFQDIEPELLEDYEEIK